MLFIRPTLNRYFNWRNAKVFTFVTRLRTGLSYLCEHKFKHTFQNSLNSICMCDSDVGSYLHFFLHSPLFQNEKRILLNTAKNTESRLFDYSDYPLNTNSSLWRYFLGCITNTYILNTTIDFVISFTRLKSYFFKLSISSSAQLLFFTRIYSISLFPLY